MKPYLITTSAVFGLIVLAHVARVFAEGLWLFREPSFIFTSLMALALSAWGWRLVASFGKANR